jgi:hypothetical protein
VTDLNEGAGSETLMDLTRRDTSDLDPALDLGEKEEGKVGAVAAAAVMVALCCWEGGGGGDEEGLFFFGLLLAGGWFSGGGGGHTDTARYGPHGPFLFLDLVGSKWNRTLSFQSKPNMVSPRRPFAFVILLASVVILLASVVILASGASTPPCSRSCATLNCDCA